MQGQDALLLHALGRDKLPAWPRGSFADCGGIRGIVFFPFFTNGVTVSAATNFTV